MRGSTRAATESSWAVTHHLTVPAAMAVKALAGMAVRDRVTAPDTARAIMAGLAAALEVGYPSLLRTAIAKLRHRSVVLASHSRYSPNPVPGSPMQPAKMAFRVRS